MAPENARVFLAEDDSTFRRAARRFIEGSSHQVSVEANTLGDAISAIPKAKELGVNVAVLDGNLTEDDTSGYDGETLATALRDEIPDIKIVSFSGQPQSYGDVHINKGHFDEVKGLGETITKL